MTSTSTLLPPNARQFTIGSVLHDTIAMLRAHPKLFFGLACVAWLPGAILALLFFGWFSIFVNFLIIPVNFIMALLIQGSISHAVSHTLQRQSTDIRASLSESMGRLAPLLCLSLIVGVISILLALMQGSFRYASLASGFIALLLPSRASGFGAASCGASGVVLLLLAGSLFMACALNAAIPICALERLGPIDSMKRSFALTYGYRLKILGLIFLSSLATTCFILILSTPINLMFFWFPFLKFLAGQLLVIITQAFMCLLPPITYYRLREAKEGVTPGQPTE